jgi:hypothetical protein
MWGGTGKFVFVMKKGRKVACCSNEVSDYLHLVNTSVARPNRRA